MRRIKLIALGAMLGFATLLPGTAFADFIPLPVKWSQPIGFTNGPTIIGADRLSDDTVPWIMADDFICLDPAPVKAVRWWGSYIGDATQRADSTGFAVPFDISFHASTGAHPNSRPGVVLYLQPVLAQEVFVGVDQTGDFVYRYDAYLPVDFIQIPGTEYFLDIDKPSGENWGWHDATLPHPRLDWAAFSPVGHGGPWFTFQTPRTDLAFEIMIPEPSSGVLAAIGGGLLLAFALKRRV